MLSQWAVLAWLIWTLLACSFIMPLSLCNLSSALSVPPLERVIASCSPFQFPHGFHLHPHGSSFRVNITSYLQNVICLLTCFSIFPCLPFDPSSPAFTHVLQTLLWSFSIAWCIKLKFLNWPSGSCRSCLLLSCLSCLLLTACSLNRMGCPFTVHVHLALVCPPDWHCSSHVWTPHCCQLQSLDNPRPSPDGDLASLVLWASLEALTAFLSVLIHPPSSETLPVCVSSAAFFGFPSVQRALGILSRSGQMPLQLP